MKYVKGGVDDYCYIGNIDCFVCFLYFIYWSDKFKDTLSEASVSKVISFDRVPYSINRLHDVATSSFVELKESICNF